MNALRHRAGCLARLYDAFFTTEGELGSGLELWITADIVHKYDGRMAVRTRTAGPSGTSST